MIKKSINSLFMNITFTKKEREDKIISLFERIFKMKSFKCLIAGSLVVLAGTTFICSNEISKNKANQREIEKLVDTLTYYKDFNENFTSCLKGSKYEKYLDDEDLIQKIQSVYTASFKDIQNKEKAIVEYATKLVKLNDNDKVQSAFEAVTQLFEGPYLTLLDGAPGSGKSTLLAEMVKSINVPVICLGATSSAAKGLYEDIQDATSSARVYAGISVDQFINPQTTEQIEIKKIVDDLIINESKVILMVDEAGLLDHDQMYYILRYAAKMKGVKVVLAGDSKQILPSKGIPFKFLTETLRETKAYVSTSYVFRQFNFLDKMITFGIYQGLYSDKILINKKYGTQFLNAAYNQTEGMAEPPRVGEYFEKKEVNVINPMADLIGSMIKKGEMTFKQYIDQKYPNVSTRDAIEKYVTYLAEQVEQLVGTNDDDLKGKLDIGPTKENYDSYLAAALVLQQMGVRGYEIRGMLKQEPVGDDETLLKDVAKEIALNYGNPKKFKHGMLAITPTEEVASKLNSLVREEMKKNNTFPKREPVYIDGSKSLMSKEEIAQLTKPYSYAYALDVITSQGMTIGGKVIFVITAKDQEVLRGGEILVGCSRHKRLENQFEIKLSAQADKNLFYKHSTMQHAGLKFVGDVFNQDLYKVVAENTNDVVLQDKLERSKAILEKDRQEFKDYLKANACFMAE